MNNQFRKLLLALSATCFAMYFFLYIFLELFWLFQYVPTIFSIYFFSSCFLTKNGVPFLAIFARITATLPFAVVAISPDLLILMCLLSITKAFASFYISYDYGFVFVTIPAFEAIIISRILVVLLREFSKKDLSKCMWRWLLFRISSIVIPVDEALFLCPIGDITIILYINKLKMNSSFGP